MTQCMHYLRIYLYLESILLVSESKQPETESLEQRKVYYRARQGDEVAHGLKNLKLPEELQQSIKGQVRQARVGSQGMWSD